MGKTEIIRRVGEANPDWERDYKQGDTEYCVCNPYGPCEYHRRFAKSIALKNRD